MAQFDVYRVRGFRHLAVDVQHKFLNGEKTRVVIPLRAIKEDEKLPKVKRLMPILPVDRTPMMLLTLSMAAVLVKDLEGPIGSLEEHRQEIIDAIDFMLLGF